MVTKKLVKPRVKKSKPASRKVNRTAAEIRASKMHPIHRDLDFPMMSNPFRLPRTQEWDMERVLRELCDKIACSSRSVSTLLADGYTDSRGKTWDFPSYGKILQYRRDNPAAEAMYQMAKVEQVDFMAEEILDISDDGTNDYVRMVDPTNPGYKLHGEHVTRSRLRTDNRKWLMSKLKPKIYGERQVLAGDPEAPLHSAVKPDLSKLTDVELSAYIALQEKVEGKA